jgi:HEAT repeat protein
MWNAVVVQSRVRYKQDFKAALSARREGNVTALIGFMQRPSDSPEYSVRPFAARSLGKHKSPPVVDALLDALDDPEFDVRAAAIGSLGRIGDKRAVQPLTDHLGLPTSDAETVILLNALRALDAQPTPADTLRLEGHTNPRVRRALARATAGPRRNWFDLRR